MTIDGIMIEPIAAVSAVDEPDTPEKKIVETMTTCPKPPRMCPTSALATATSHGWDGLVAAQRRYLADFWGRADVEVGDAIIGLRSSGVHSNGLTLARKVLEGATVGLDQKFDRLGGSIGQELLRPTTIYVRDVMRMLDKVRPTGMVDITGGGLTATDVVL